MPVKVDAWASEDQYAEHIRPIFDRLPSDMRGTWQRHGNNPVLIAGYKDILAVGSRPSIFVEHGAGQTYGVGHPSYSGGRNRESVKLFICPGDHVVKVNRSRYPNTPAVAVGCPKLDPYLALERPVDGVVAMAWHWNATVVPEARSALLHYREVLPEIAQRFDVIGTAHPRIMRAAAKVYADAGIPVVGSDEVFRRAEVLVCDNTSLGWEFMALDRPVVWCNAPWYRRTVHHGMRFWDYADSGVQVDQPQELADGIECALRNHRENPRAKEAAEYVYAYRDGHAAERAAEAIVEHFGG